MKKRKKIKIYLVRHGQCNSNVKRVINYIDEDLNEKGVKETQKLRAKIEKIDYDVIYSSSLLRAKHTAEIINIKNKEIIVDKRLTERMPGDLEGVSFSNIDMKKFWNYYDYKQISNEETIKDFFERVKGFLNELKTSLEKTSYTNILIVAHSGICKAFEAYFNGIKNGDFSHIHIENLEINEYILD